MRKLSKILVIDTATKHIYLSLVINGIEVQSVYQVGINNHSVTIIPLLNEMLDKQDLSLQELDEVIVGIGPGSYTGVRIGVTVAKMIGYLNQIKVSTISSLALIASASGSEYIVPYIDARRGNAFIATMKQSEGKLTFVKDECLENIDAFIKQLDVAYDFRSEGHPDIKKILASNLLNPVTDIHELKPNYLRITEAERNKRGNKY